MSSSLTALLGLADSGKCICPDEAIPLIFGLGISIILGTLVLATTSNNATGQNPHLGVRPKGTELWSWFYNYLKDDVGVSIGYDTILGCLSPTLRIAFHLGLSILLWSLLLIVWPTIMSLMIETTYAAAATGASGHKPKIICLNNIDLNIWQAGITAIMLYSFVVWRISNMVGVSVPGGPRQCKIQRQPKWSNTQHKIQDQTLLDGKLWKCLVANESHKDTLTKFQSKALTGEAVGRQIWSSSASSSATSSLSASEEASIQDMASGGRCTASNKNEFGTFNPSKNPNSCDMIFRAQQIRNYVSNGGTLPTTNDSKKKTVKESIKQATHFYSMLQTNDGHWAGDYGGPHFLMPGLVIAWHIMGRSSKFLNEEQIKLLTHYILVHQQLDGGWGTHIESPSTMFGSTLMYVTLRLLGVVDKNHPAVIKGRQFLQENGGALMTASWSKFYLCLLGVMDWKGHNSVPCEMWLLPNWFPFHPGRMWCHARMVYLPMGYLYGTRYVYDKAESDPLILELRKEIYCESYDTIDWCKTRHWVAPMDNYSPIPWFMKTLQNILAKYENWFVFQPLKNYIRQYGLLFSLEYMHAEDLQTNYIDIGPVNKVLNMISMYHASGNNINDEEVVKHLMRVQDYLWIAEDGMKMQGYNGSQW